ncbi:MAG TPA: VWA domain-containing protein [Bryobacteraceae bacterium]|nr:VWA domain-containing protein [Bryobacteraceae bacterium]
MGRLIASALACLLLPLSGPAQTSFKVDVKLIRLLATVKDGSGKLIGGLEKTDFELLDSGVPQQISVFERQTGQPLSVAIVVDVSGSTAREIPYEADALDRFLKALFREGDPHDRASLYTFNWEIRQQTGFTRDGKLIERRLRATKAEAGTSLYDGISLAAQDLDKLEGRKVMILITDGGDTTSSTRFHEALEAAQRADAVVYAVLVVPIANDPGRNVGGENALELLTTGTGGRVFRPEIREHFANAFDEILRDLRTQYLIGYYPKNLPYQSDSRYRRISLRTKRPELRVSTRSGYYE